MLSNHAKGSQRDRLILTAIEKHGALNTDQVAELFFSGIKNGKRMAQKRLKRLYDTNRLRRCRYYIDQPYIYYIDRRPGNTEHLINVNWVYVWLVRNLKSWESMEVWNIEEPFGEIRPDAVAGIRNKVTKELKVQFIEMDMATSKNDFTKVQKYNAFYENEGYIGCWWEPLVTRFPFVLIVTTSERKAESIRRKVEEQNTHGIDFRIMTLAEVVG